MTPTENAAFRAGILHAADLALIAALAIETREDARHLRQRAAIAALRSLADGLKTEAVVSCSQSDLNRQMTEAVNLLQPNDLL